MANSFKQLYKEKKEIEKEEELWAIEKPLLERHNQLLAEQEEIKTKKQKLSTSKRLILFLFINCSIIEIFTGWATIRMLSMASNTGLIDFTPLVTLIGTIVSEVFGYAIYSLKSAKENSTGGIIYDMAMQNLKAEKEENIID